MVRLISYMFAGQHDVLPICAFKTSAYRPPVETYLIASLTMTAHQTHFLPTLASHGVHTLVGCLVAYLHTINRWLLFKQFSQFNLIIREKVTRCTKKAIIIFPIHSSQLPPSSLPLLLSLTCTCMPVHTNTHSLHLPHIQINTYTHTYTHKPTFTHKHTHTHTHTHQCSISIYRFFTYICLSSIYLYTCIYMCVCI